MIALSPLASWLLLAALCALGVWAAITAARFLDRLDDEQEYRRWQADVDAWQEMCRELELEDRDPPASLRPDYNPAIDADPWETSS